MQKDLDQATYDTLYSAMSAHVKVYPTSPPKDTAYPFVRMGAIQIVPLPTKTYGLASIYFNFDVYGTLDDRSTVSQIATKCMQSLLQLTTLQGDFNVRANIADTSKMLLVENTQDQDLWRAECSLKYTAF